MKPARLILLVVALVAGGLAAVFALNRSPVSAPTQVAEPAKVELTKVLVASETIGIGTRIEPGMLSWQEWPEGALRSEFITNKTSPDATTQLANAVARFEIFVGEPVRLAKLVQSNSGYLSAVITPGMRGVGVIVTAASGAGGFIVPNDRVDVIVTLREGSATQTILTNVRVIAIGKRLGEKGDTGKTVDSETVFEDETVATLELTPSQSESLVNAARIGEISLVLRSITDFAEGGPGGGTNNNASVQMIKGGTLATARVNAQPEALASDQQSAQLQPIVFADQTATPTAPANVITNEIISSTVPGGETPPLLE